jgi:hypothetical protein
MKLVPTILLSHIPNLYETDESTDPICHIKLFTPDSCFSWYVIELSKSDLNTCFGYVIGLESELGYFSIEELELIHGPLGLSVERDLSFKPTALSKLKQST